MRRRILLINTTFKFEGPNDVFWQLARNADPRRFEILCACMHGGGPMEELYSQAGLRTHNFGMERFSDLASVLRVRDFVRAEKIDLVMAQLLRSEVFGGMGAWLAGAPLVLVVQNIDPYRADPLSFPSYYLSRLSMKWPVKVVAASEHVRRFVMENQRVKPRQIITIHDGIDETHFPALAQERDSVRKEFGVGPDEIAIGSVARYDPQKGLPYLVEAFGRLAARHKDIRLILVGEGPQREELEGRIREVNGGGRVTLTGFRRDYDRIIQGLDIFVLPSIWEGLPLALLSAMASSKPVVSTTVSGIPEAVEDGVSGCLVRPADTEGLAEKIEALIKDPGLRARLGKNARERVVKDFSARVMTRKYEALWEECLAAFSPVVRTQGISGE